VLECPAGLGRLSRMSVMAVFDLRVRSEVAARTSSQRGPSEQIRRPIGRRRDGGGWSRSLGLVVGLAIAAAAGLTWSPVAHADVCPNNAVRQQQGSAALADCRAYEMVSPVDKNGGDALAYLSQARSSSSGDRAIFGSFNGFANTPSLRYLLQYMASRTATGWSTASLIPQQNFGNLSTTNPPQAVGLSPDLSKVVDQAGDPAPDRAAQPGTYNLFERDSATRLFGLLTPAGVASASFLAFDDASDDFSHVLFESTAKLTHDAPIDNANAEPTTLSPNSTPSNLYENVNGEVRLVGILPDGTPAPNGARAGFVLTAGGSSLASGGLGGGVYTQDAMSRDGSRIFWTDFGTNQIYARLDGDRTVAVSASQRSTPDTTQPATFQGATPSGSDAYFLSTERLTDDSNPGSGGNGEGDLYAYDVDSGRLTDLMAVPGRTAVGLGLLGASADGSYVYFAANGDSLAAGAPASQTNIYVWHEGALSFVATLPDVNASNSGADVVNWAVSTIGGVKTARVSADGRYLVFSSIAPLTAYDNAGRVEFYRYDAASGLSPTCVSCNPSGAPATADASIGTDAPNAQGRVQGAAPLLTNDLSSDGRRVFFQTADSLVPSDTNGRMDVYEWEDGHVHLISSGRDASDSYLGDASLTGDDVFFTTRQALVPQDQDTNSDMYDARVNGGFPTQAAVPPCSGDTCQGNPSAAPVLPAPASPTVFGTGNYVAPSPGGHASAVTLSVASVTRQARARFGQTGRLGLSVTSSGAGRITAVAYARIGGKLKVVATATRMLRRRGNVRLTITLSKAARSELHVRHKLGLRVTVSAPGARSRVARFTLTSRGR
jgi:hypothetical protein